MFSQSEELLLTLSIGDSLYPKWPQFESLLKDQLLTRSSLLPASDGEPVKAADLSILCGSEKLCKNLSAAGFTNITKLDFSYLIAPDDEFIQNSKVSIEIYENWKLKFADESFDVIVEMGVYDALMLPDVRYTGSGSSYTNAVKRILKTGGKFICITFAEQNALDLLLTKFRFGWKITVHPIPSEELKQQTFMFVVEKDSCASVSLMTFFVDTYSLNSHGDRVAVFFTALFTEQAIRASMLALKTVKQLDLESLKKCEPGRTIELILGEPGDPIFYKAVLVDAEQDPSRPFLHHFAAYIVPITRVDEWLFSNKQGQICAAANSEASRLLIILLDSSHDLNVFDTKTLEAEVTRLAQPLAPRDFPVGDPIMFVNTATIQLKQRDIVYEVTSDLTGPIIVDEVISPKNRYEDNDDLVFRRLIFLKPQAVVQSEALLDVNKVQGASKTRKKKKGKQKISEGSRNPKASSGDRKVNHDYLASTYNVIISGLLLFFPHLQKVSSSTGSPMMETVVIGLGAGLLPMFMKNRLPLKIVVVERDPVVLNIAEQHFGFAQDQRLEVRIDDGIQFVGKKANPVAVHADIVTNISQLHISDGIQEEADSVAGESSRKLDILIVDVNSRDTSDHFRAPSEEFFDDSFLQDVNNSLSDNGLFVVNVLVTSSEVMADIHSVLKGVFGKKIVSFKLEENQHEVIFMVKNEKMMTRFLKNEDFNKAANRCVVSLEKESMQEWITGVKQSIKLMKICLVLGENF
ncbi:hypothetical protein ACP275_04G236300 [Erythranthe tilingii]